jgi:hypothetical protein
MSGFFPVQAQGEFDAMGDQGFLLFLLFIVVPVLTVVVIVLAIRTFARRSGPETGQPPGQAQPSVSVPEGPSAWECACGAGNGASRDTCWRCGGPFPKREGEPAAADPDGGDRR